jgi:DNA primase catalytic core
MSNLTEWIKLELYPVLFESIDKALPEHNFKQYAGGWRSKTYLDSSPHKDREDKTVVNKQAPTRILEQGGESLSLIDYVIKRDSVDFITAVKTLAEVVGLQLPQTDFNKEDYIEYSKTNNILEDCNSYFIYCLENSTGAEDVRDYLYSRGYSDEDIKTMELGYIPDQSKLYSYLTDKKNYNLDLVNKALSINNDNRIGSTHKLTIPYRSGGIIKGFKFRTIGGTTPKYLNSTGLDKLGGFFNLSGIKGDKDLVIVEGELDSLSATARGLNNVVSTGGSSISSEQVKDAIKRGAKSFTLCFDNEPKKAEETDRNINKAIEVILAEGVNKVYIVTLPELGEKTDPDSYIKAEGVDAFKNVLRGALSFYQHRLNSIFFAYGEIAEREGGLSQRSIDNLLTEVVETASKLNPLDRDIFTKEFISQEAIKELGIKEESLEATVDKLKTTRDREAQKTEFNNLLGKAKDLQDKGETREALDLLESKLKEVKLQDKATEFSKLLLPTSEAQIKEEESSLPESLNTGFIIDKDELLLPSGAISVYVAPTNHGKTILLINTALNVAERYPEKKFVFFTYEERDTTILQYFLNTYIDLDLNGSKKANRRLIREYFKTGSTEFFKRENIEYFESKKEEFFKTYIETGRLLVKYVDYNSQDLTTAIEYLNKEVDNLGGVFIDYFQLLNLSGKVKREERINSRQEELKQICISLKDTAVKTGLPLCLAAQFNREATNLMRLHPTNIGEAGDIERIVNTLIGLWNMSKKTVLKSIGEAEQGEINARIKQRGLTEDAKENNMYLEILKSRELPTGTYDFLKLNGNTGKVKNREERYIREVKKDIF